MIRRLKSARLVGLRFSSPLFFAILGSVLIGASPIFVKMTDLGPLSTGFHRLFLALPFPLMWRRYEGTLNPESMRPLSKKEFFSLLAAGAFFAFDLGLWHYALDLTTVMNATLFNNFVPFFVPIVTFLIFKEKISYIFMLAVLLALFGVAILTGESFKLSADYVIGDLLGLASALMFVGYVIILKEIRKRHNTPTIMLWSSFSNAICLGVFAMIAGESMIPETWKDWIGILGLAVFVHIGGQGMLAYSLAHLSASITTLTMLISPIVSAIAAWVFFGEDITLLELIGGTIILFSIVLARYDEVIKKQRG